MVIKLIVFGVVTAGLLIISRTSLQMRGSHGFFRFFAWESILLLMLLNMDSWHIGKSESSLLIIARLCLIVSLYLVLDGVRLLHFVGKSKGIRDDDTLISLEKTTVLVTSGLYKFIRHPMYSSLLFFVWGVFFLSPSWLGGGVTMISMLFLNAAAKAEESENIHYFGEAYRAYIQNSKRFIPFVY